SRTRLAAREKRRFMMLVHAINSSTTEMPNVNRIAERTLLLVSAPRAETRADMPRRPGLEEAMLSVMVLSSAPACWIDMPGLRRPMANHWVELRPQLSAMLATG